MTVTDAPRPADRAAPAAPPSGPYGCPACGTAVPGAINRACEPCTATATDSRKRGVRLEPLSATGFEARYIRRDGAAENDVAPDVTAFRTCFINGHPYFVAQPGDGSIALVPMADTLPGGPAARLHAST